MEPKRTLARTLAAAVFAALLAPAAAHALDDPYERGMEAYERGHWLDAMSWFEVAAEEDGNLRAKEILGYMHLVGPRLYPGLERDIGLAKVWLSRAAAQGSREAARVIARLEAPTLPLAPPPFAAVVFSTSEGE